MVFHCIFIGKKAFESCWYAGISFLEFWPFAAYRRNSDFQIKRSLDWLQKDIFFLLTFTLFSHRGDVISYNSFLIIVALIFFRMSIEVVVLFLISDMTPSVHFSTFPAFFSGEAATDLLTHFALFTTVSDLKLDFLPPTNNWCYHDNNKVANRTKCIFRQPPTISNCM